MKAYQQLAARYEAIAIKGVKHRGLLSSVSHALIHSGRLQVAADSQKNV
jgi:hypothetical protein